MNDDPRGSLKTGGGGVGTASTCDAFLRFFGSCSFAGALSSFFGLPRFGGEVTTSTSSVAAVAFFFGLPRFLGAPAGVVAAASIDADADAPAESDAAAVAFCFLCRFAGSAVERYPSGSPFFRKQSSILHSTRSAGS